MIELLIVALIGGGLLWAANRDENGNILKGGRGDKLTARDVDARELRMGVTHELEHLNTGDKKRDRAIAKEIALDHLAEHRDYYSKLEAAESGMGGPSRGRRRR